jgi:hypothetical protein
MEYMVGWGIGIAIIVVAASLCRPLPDLVRALAHRAAGRSAADPEIAELRQGLAAMQTRLGELEERVDFAERLLAKGHESERLPTARP